MVSKGHTTASSSYRLSAKSRSCHTRGISSDELDAMKSPASYERPADPVPQPTEPHPLNQRARHGPVGYERLAAMDDAIVWDRLSETTPPVSRARCL